MTGSREFWTDTTGEFGVKYADRLGLPNPFNVAGWPGLYDTGLSGYYFETGNPQATAFTYLIADDNATKILGKHELQFGFHFRYDPLNYLPDQQHPQGNHNWATGATARVPLDNFRVTPRLTLNLGLRWEYWPPFGEKNNVMTTFDPNRRAVVPGQDFQTMYRLGATLPSIVERLEFLGVRFISYSEAGLPRNLREGYWRDFGPRLGFAYRLGADPRPFVPRGGYRTSYFPIPMYTWGQPMRMNAPLTARFITSLTDPAQAPDGIGAWGLQSVPAVGHDRGIQENRLVEL